MILRHARYTFDLYWHYRRYVIEHPWMRAALKYIFARMRDTLPSHILSLKLHITTLQERPSLWSFHLSFLIILNKIGIMIYHIRKWHAVRYAAISLRQIRLLTRLTSFLMLFSSILYNDTNSAKRRYAQSIARIRLKIKNIAFDTIRYECGHRNEDEWA